jgi:hydrophobe/amphiphile efflux-3 (HAE3) family protein
VLARGLSAIVGAAARRPVAVLAVVVVLVAGAAAFALRLEPAAGTDTFVGRGTASYQASQRYHQKFGDDAVIVLVRGELSKLVLTADIERILGLEGCISGNLPAGVEPRGGTKGPCGELARTKPVKVVFGPGTFINESVRQISDEFTRQQEQAKAEGDKVASAARKLALARGYSKARAAALAKQARELRNAQFLRDVVRLGLAYGITSIPRLNDPSFVSRLVFGSQPGVPKQRFAYLFPNRNSAIVQVRLKPGLGQKERVHAIDLVRRAVAMPDWKLANGSYVVSGAPVVLADLTDSITASIRLLLLAVGLVMAATLALVFRVRLRLLPLLTALGAAALTFGGLSAAGASLTMASIAVLPVLVGLAVDYAIQFQSRVQESGGDVRRAAAVGGPTIVTAGAATAAGFLVLALSPVPMVRGFGILLVAGIGLAFALTLTAGAATLAATRGRRAPRPARAAGEALAPALRGAGGLLADNPPVRWARRRAGAGGRRMLRLAIAHPGRLLAGALVVAAAGWALDTQTKVESDVQKLVPQDLQALRDLRVLEDVTGVGGEIDVVVTSDKLTDPATVAWMGGYQQKLLKRFGYSAKRGCGKAELCPAFSLPDLFTGGAATSAEQIGTLLDAVPAYFSQGVITRDRKTATLAFGIRLMPLDEQQRVVKEMQRGLDPPAGVHAELAGLPVLAAEANEKVASPWRRVLQLLAGLLAVAVVLLLAFRRPARALVPLVPIVLATGWSALVIFLTRIPLNPMSVTLGALVIAISTEFSVLLSERYRQEREAGHGLEAALARTYASTGRAVAASGATAIAGFAVLVLSDIRMLRDFGLVTVVDLTVSLLGVLLVLPAALALAERGVRVPRPALPRRPRRRASRAAAG